MTVPDQAAVRATDGERHIKRNSPQIHGAQALRKNVRLQTPVNAPQGGQLKLYGPLGGIGLTFPDLAGPESRLLTTGKAPGFGCQFDSSRLRALFPLPPQSKALCLPVPAVDLHALAGPVVKPEGPTANKSIAVAGMTARYGHFSSPAAATNIWQHQTAKHCRHNRLPARSSCETIVASTQGQAKAG